MVDNEGRAVELRISPDGDYGEWISGEGADICLYFNRDDPRRVTGCRLPLYHDRLIVSCGRYTVVFEGGEVSVRADT
jgi:hypothetical protein